MLTKLKKWVLPGLVFQSVVIAGGYGTGREIAEFFLSRGPLGGLLAMVLVSTVIWSAVNMASFEFARVFRRYDYRTFFKTLLGPAWVSFEVLYVIQLVIVLAVIAAAAGTMLRETFNLPYAVGVVGITAAVGFLVFRGSETIERVLTGWSVVLYGTYLVFFVWGFSRFGAAIADALSQPIAGAGWIVGGVQYAGYNLAVVPAVLFAVRHAETRRDALIAGALSGPIAIIPGVLFYLVMVGQYPAVVGQAVPANFLLAALGSRGLTIVFQVVLFGTLIETGAGMIHAVNERLASAYRDRGRDLPRFLRPVAAVGLLALAAGLSRFGLIDLIAKGYGTLTWAFIAVFVIPVLTWGVWKIRAAKP
ncbi:MAG TPA: hypothetical protein VGA37_09295 [Gemmatimonadales bacterium]